MKFLNYNAVTERKIIAKQFADYEKYLEENKKYFPPSAFEFASAKWHYDNLDSRCPHDSWVTSVVILENADRKDLIKREMEIRINLLGAYQDGEIEIKYQGIKGYSFQLFSDLEYVGNRIHGDWYIDEVHLSEKGWIIHEIKLLLSGEWRIECEDIKYEWKPYK